MEIELVYADGDDFHKLEMLMVETDLRMFIDGEEKQIVGKIWIGHAGATGDGQGLVPNRQPSEREDTEVSAGDQDEGARD